jgi:GTP-binding protein HflX
MKKSEMFDTKPKKESAFLVGIDYHRSVQYLGVNESLEELELLSQTAGLVIAGSEQQKINTPNPATFIGKGKVEEIKILVENLNVDVVIFDEELSPRNYRELEKEFGTKTRVIDRTTLILDIFAQHARTREGQLQVELAQYEYFLPRLTRAWSHLARQAGGGGGRSGSVGGVGLRGPGETQLEVDRRQIRERISRLKKELEKVRDHRNRYRQNRRRSNIPVVALVGYTNAGKSTLINALTNAGVYVADQLFATLDPTTRRWDLPGGNSVLISDTVGFIQKLPTHLVAAFRATLEEIAEADLLLHVVDASHPDAVSQWRSVMDTLKELQADHIPLFTVLNKIDELENPTELASLIPEFENSICISALKKINLNELEQVINQTLFEKFLPINVNIPYKNGDLISEFHKYGRIEQINHGIGEVNIIGEIPGRLVADFERFQRKEKESKNPA